MTAHVAPPFGLPYARSEKIGETWGHICPVCEMFCPEPGRKDSDSVTYAAYAEHFAEAEAAEVARVLAEYERIARANRAGDWATFVVEARTDPIDITYEVAETAHGLGLDGLDFDRLQDATEAWLAAVVV